jgi:hypothetical protein
MLKIQVFIEYKQCRDLECLPFLTRKILEMLSCEKSVTISHSTRHNTTEDLDLHQHR